MLRELALGSHPHLPSKTTLSFTAPNNETTRLIRLIVTGRNLAKVVVEDATFNGKSLLLKKGVPAATFDAVQANAWIAIADKKNPLVADDPKGVRGIFEVPPVDDDASLM